MTKESILLKFGGSVITNKQSMTPSINQSNLDKIGNLINTKKYDLIIVHGAGSFGHPIAKEFKLSEGIIDNKRQENAVQTAREQLQELNNRFCQSLIKINTETIIPSEFMETKGPKEIIKFPKDAFDRTMNEGKVPVTFGDVTKDVIQGINILSGDVIMKKLAEIYRPRFTIFLMDLPGVLDNAPNDSESEIIPLVNSVKLDTLRNKIDMNNIDVTGGIIGKIESAREISKYSETWITNLDSLERCLKGKPRGTQVVV